MNDDTKATSRMAIRYGILVGFMNDAIVNGKYKDITGNQLCRILMETLNDMDREAEE